MLEYIIVCLVSMQNTHHMQPLLQLFCVALAYP